MSNMDTNFDLQEYLTKGVEGVIADAVKATLKNPRESAFMLKFAAASKAASKRRRKLEDAGEHVPSFLIASITSKCNLHCAGCYSRCNHATVDAEPVSQLTDEEWLRIFDEADELGISFILLAGGEPMLRRDIIEAAGKKQNIMFPIFTNGTFMDERYFELFDRRRNLLPEMVYVSFPGDEKSSGGCVAAGRGFFHINSHGGAEPCPFSPYSDINVRNTSLRDALHSPLFMALRDGGVLMDDHEGGCVLYEKRELVESILAGKAD